MDIGIALTGDGTGVSYPASLAQSRFWLLDALDPGTPALNVAVRWELHGPVSHGAVQAAMDRIVARHEILRTALQSKDGVPEQVVRPGVALRVGHHDLSHLPTAARLAEADRIGSDEARTPFALEAAPLLRVSLLTLAAGEARLLVTMHHAICDGWSIGVLARELTHDLSGAGPLPELALQYGDYAEWQQAWLQSDALEVATSYWMRQLADLPYVTVPPDTAAGESRGAGAIASILLPRSVTDGMAAAAVQAGCTPFAVALAALGRMLQDRTGADDIAIGTQIAGRTEVELEGMIGPFINTLVLRLDVAGAPDWATRVQRAGATVESALHHHAMPFELLIRALNPRRTPRRTPLFSVNFIFQRSFVAPFEDGGVRLVDLPSHSAGALYDLNFFMVERPDGWRASCEYDTGLFEPARVEAMLGAWRLALSGKALDPAPADTTLDRVSAIWRDVLGVATVSPQDGFFDLGGHSLLAARMLARVEAEFGQRIGMAALFTDNTLGGLAALLAQPTAGTAVLAVGEPGTWAALQGALGPELPVHPVTAAEVGAAAALYPGASLAVLGTGADGPAALSLARGLVGAGRTVTLVLVDAAAPAPSRGLRSLFKPAKEGPFEGRAVLFRTEQSAASVSEWADHLVGALDVVPLTSERWHEAVAKRIREL